MKSRAFLVELFLVFVLLSSCVSSEEVILNQDNNPITSSSFEETDRKHLYEDEYAIVDVVALGDRMLLSFTNKSKHRILLHIELAQVGMIDGAKTSQIVTFKQSKQATGHFKISAIIVNPSTTFTEEYVALDAMNFDLLNLYKYVISQWANDEDFHLSVPYGLLTFKGEVMRTVIIN